MKQWLFFCLALSTCSISNGQYFNDFAGLNRKTVLIPLGKTFSTDSIAGYMKLNFKNAPEKLLAIYNWVATNIRYDTDSMYPINWSLDHEEKIAATLRRKKGVCENYAAVFTDIAIKSGFPSFVVNGYTREAGSVNRSGHSWSAVQLQGEWFLCDPTWDAGYGDTKYFLVSPSEFIGSHMPFDPLWQLLEHPITEREFQSGFFHSKKNQPVFNFPDSIQAFFKLDSLQQLLAATRRTRQAGIENERQKNWVAYNQMKIAGMYGENDMILYNSAVADLNKANLFYNDFVKYRNNQFMPTRPDAEIHQLLNPVKSLLADALKKLEQMGKEVENFQYDPSTLKEQIVVLAGRVQVQQNFVKQWLGTDVLDRVRLFYK
ncbi:MAG: transglutaminase domain-containing protein [Ferruginibacter sp.]